jgi:predicted TPR repeat methyltransferase
VSHYDEAAATYDGLFTRPVDGWENETLAGLLAPLVDRREVLDLGCGTGWLADHCRPGHYTGVDCSGPMLAELERKHGDAYTVKANVAEPGWWEMLPQQSRLRAFGAITATWSLDYLGDLDRLLHTFAASCAPGTVLALHGSMPRGHRRAHFSVKSAPYTPIGPHQVAAASARAALGRPACTGTSMLPDRLAGLGVEAWRAALTFPAGMHYAALWVWQL